MALHQQHNLAFQAPSEWSETTVAAFRSRPSSEAPATVLLVSREAAALADTFDGHVARTLVQLGRELRQLVIRETRALDVGGRRAMSIRLEFESSNGRYEQTLVMVDPELAPDGKVWAFVVTGPIESRDEARATLDDILRTARFEEPSGPRTDPFPNLPMPPLGARREARRS